MMAGLLKRARVLEVARVALISMAMAFTVGGLSWASPSLADRPAWAVFVPKADKVGAGQFRWWGFLVYDATLWSPSGEYRPDEPFAQPFALSLRYARDISKEDIVKASIDQMRDLGLPVDRHPEWAQKLSQVMASVKSGDTLTGVYTPGQGAVFFHNDKLTGQVDERLARGFFDIWLDPKTSEPKLRQALLGQDREPGAGQ